MSSWNAPWYIEERALIGDDNYQTISISEPLSYEEADKLYAKLVDENVKETYFVKRQENNEWSLI